MSGLVVSWTQPDVPPSLNKVGPRSHWSVFRREKEKWEQIVSAAMLVRKVPRHYYGHCRASAELRFAKRRRRDTGNFQALLEKAVGDALVAGLWLPDDTHRHFEFDVTFDEEPGPSRTELRFCFS